MRNKIKNHLDKALAHLYVNPLERCNLRCRICYTRKTSPVLTELQILEFVYEYQKYHKLETVTFCGGEVFTLGYFPGLVNILTGKGIFVTVITNGTIDKLIGFEKPNSINLIVSIDGMEDYHDKNRGIGNFKKSLNFLKKAHNSGFHTEVFSIVTRQNYGSMDKFESKLERELTFTPRITYHPRKPPSYLLHHPVSNVFGETDGFDFLTTPQMVEIISKRNVFPPKNLGCYQIALVSDGNVYGCCEGTVPLGRMDNDVKFLFDKLKERIILWESINTSKNCLGCSQPDFMCGIKKYL